MIILGYILEALTTFIKKGSFKSGIMFGPWTPIYGIGVIIILLISKYLFKHLHLSKVYEIIIVLLSIIVILTALEWLGGILIEKLFHKSLWDYSDKLFHIGKYISLTASLTWGLGSIIVIYIIHPILKNFINKIPWTLSLLLLLIFIIDFIYTVIKNIKI